MWGDVARCGEMWGGVWGVVIICLASTHTAFIHTGDVGRAAMYTYRPYMHPCVLPMRWQGQTSRECIVHSVSYAIRTIV